MHRTNSRAKTENGLRAHLSKTVALGALMAMAGVVAPTAIAQETQGEEETTRRLGTVEVTATRREGVTVQDVPIAVTAFDATLLEQQDFNRLNDLEQLSPSVQITQGQSASAGTSISIRGIGTGADNFGFEPAVGIFVDGVYRTRTGSGIQELPELAGVEVLRGPQGTLFGRNTSAGVVSIRTAKPTFEPSGYASASYGNFDAVELNVGASGEIAENFAARFDGKFRRRDGFIEDVNSDRDFNNIERFALRGQLLYEKNESSLRLIADYTETNEDCCAVTIVELGDFAPLVQAVAASNGLVGNLDPTDPANRFRTAVSPNQSFRDEVQDWGVSAEYEQGLGWADFTSITALRVFDSVRDQDIDFSGLDRAARDGTTNADRAFTQEFRLSGQAGKLDWLVGAFYLNEDIETFDTIQFGTDADVFSDASFAGFSASNPGVPPLSLFGTNVAPGPGGGATPFLFTDTAGLSGLPPGTVVPFGILGPVLTGAGEAAAAQLLPLLLSGAIDQATFDAQLAAAVAGAQGTFTPFFLPPTPAGAGAFDTFNQTTNAIAIFTHNQYEVTDKLTLTGGLRYNYEERSIRANLDASSIPGCAVLQDPATSFSTAAVPGLNPLLPFFGVANLFACNPAVNPEFDVLDGARESRSDSEFTGTVKAAYALTDDILLFGGYNRGFKSGGFNLDRSSLESSFVGTALGVPNDGPQLLDLEFEPETVDSFEAGFKSSWFDRRLTVNATGFFTQVDDFQENTFNGTNFVVFNNDVETFGVELDVGAEPIDGLVLQGGFIWVDATRTAIDPDSPPLAGAVNPDGTNTGQQLGNTPEFVITGSGTYIFPLTEGFEGTLHANVRWQSDTNLVQGTLFEAFENGAFATVGARAGVQTTDGKYALSVFATNLFDQDFNVTAFGVPEQTGTLAAFPGAPRFWGGEFKVRF